MNKSIILLFACMALCLTTVVAQSEVNLQWKTQFGQPDTIPWSTSIVTTDGSVLVTGNTEVQNQQTNVYLAKYDRNGNLLWHTSYNHSYNGRDYGAALALDSYGNIIIAGASETSATNGLDLSVLKANSSGTLLWSYYYNYEGNADDVGSAVVIDEDDKIYVTGVGTSANNDADYLTIKLNETGDTVWTHKYDYNNLPDVAVDLMLSGNELLITGASSDNITKWDIATVKINRYSGNTIMERREPGAIVGYDRPTGFTKDNLGNFYIAGTSRNAQNQYVIRTIKLDTALNLIWTVDIDGHGNENESSGICIDQNGHVYITGSSKNSNNKWEWISAKIDSTGTIDWKQYQNSTDGGHAKGKGICVDMKGNLFVVGSIQTNNYYNIVTSQYKKDGKLGWQKAYNTGSNEDEFPLKIEARGNDRAIVTGYTAGNNRQYVLMRYESFDKIYSCEVNADSIPIFVKNQINVKIDTSSLSDLRSGKNY